MNRHRQEVCSREIRRRTVDGQEAARPEDMTEEGRQMVIHPEAYSRADSRKGTQEQEQCPADIILHSKEEIVTDRHLVQGMATAQEVRQDIEAPELMIREIPHTGA